MAQCSRRPTKETHLSNLQFTLSNPREVDFYNTAEEEAYSRCSSTSLSCISFTSDEPAHHSTSAVMASFKNPRIEGPKHNLPDSPVLGSHYRPSESDFVKTEILHFSPERNIGRKGNIGGMEYNKNYLNSGKRHNIEKHVVSESDFVPKPVSDFVENEALDLTVVSYLENIHLNPPSRSGSRNVTRMATPDAKENTLTSVTCQSSLSPKSATQYESTISHPPSSSTIKQSKFRHDLSSTPFRNSASLQDLSKPHDFHNQISGDFVQTSGNHTLPCSNDFVDQSANENPLETVSPEPKLEELLSGSVKSSALLRKKQDFVPTPIIPGKPIRPRRKSMPELKRSEEKMKRFLDRKGVILMDPKSKDRCTHTEVMPSSMMTLAMELLVSGDNKASALFKQARQKADGESEGKDSILPNLWVVPKQSSDEEDVVETTASHLQPCIKSRSKNTKKNDEENSMKETKITNLKSPIVHDSAVVPASSASREVPECSYRKEKLDKMEEIRNEDVIRDLQTLTVADLVGTADTVYSDSDSDDDDVLPVKMGAKPAKEIFIDAPTTTSFRTQHGVSGKDSKSCEFTGKASNSIRHKDHDSDKTSNMKKELEGRKMKEELQQSTISNEKVNINRKNVEKPNEIKKISPQIDTSQEGALKRADMITTDTNLQKQNLDSKITDEKEDLQILQEEKQMEYVNSNTHSQTEFSRPNELKWKEIIATDRNSMYEENCDVHNADLPCTKLTSPLLSPCHSLTTVSSLSLSSVASCRPASPVSSSDARSLPDDHSNDYFSLKCNDESSSQGYLGSPSESANKNEISPTQSSAIACDLHSSFTSRNKTKPSQSTEGTEKPSNNDEKNEIGNQSQTTHFEHVNQAPPAPPRGKSVHVMKELRRRKSLGSPDFMKPVQQHALSSRNAQHLNSHDKHDAGMRSYNIENTSSRDSIAIHTHPCHGEKTTRPNTKGDCEITRLSTAQADSAVESKFGGKKVPEQIQPANLTGEQPFLIASGGHLEKGSYKMNKDKSSKQYPNQMNAFGNSSECPREQKGLSPDENYVMKRTPMDEQQAKPEKFKSDGQGVKDNEKGFANARRVQNTSTASMRDMDKKKPISYSLNTSNNVVTIVDGSEVTTFAPNTSHLPNGKGSVNTLYASDLTGLEGSGHTIDLRTTPTPPPPPPRNQNKNGGMFISGRDKVWKPIFVQSQFVDRGKEQQTRTFPVSCRDAVGSCNTKRDIHLMTSPQPHEESYRSITPDNYHPTYRSSFEDRPPSKTDNRPTYNSSPKPFQRARNDNVRITSPILSSSDSLSCSSSQDQSFLSDSSSSSSNVTCITKPFRADGSRISNTDSRTSSMPNSRQAKKITLSDRGTSRDVKEPSGNFRNEENSHDGNITLKSGSQENASTRKVSFNDAVQSSTDTTDGFRPEFSKINMVMSAARTEKSYNKSKVKSHRSLKSYERSSYEKKKNVRESIMPEGKVNEKAPPSPSGMEAPPHSSVDEGDFAGVVDGPTKNVKEIRAMFKNGPDYANYAKPKLLPTKPKPALAPKPIKEQLNRSRPNSGPSHEVAQQVIGLFKGALTLEDVEPVAPTQPSPVSNGDVESHDDEPHISVKDKVASYNVGKSPVGENEVNNNLINEVIVNPKQMGKVDSPPYAEIISNQSPKENHPPVQPEKVKAASYDESLDQFYDILEELTAS